MYFCNYSYPCFQDKKLKIMVKYTKIMYKLYKCKNHWDKKAMFLFMIDILVITYLRIYI